jgi:hypothetical protein
MLNFQKYTPYKLNRDVINRAELEIYDEHYKVIGKKTYLEVIRDILKDDVPYEVKYEELGLGLPTFIVVLKGESKICIESHGYASDILSIVLDIYKERRDIVDACDQLLWLFIEHDHVLNDVHEFYRFFVCDGKEILKERVAFSDAPGHDLPDTLLQVKNDYFSSSDRGYEMAMVRKCYEKFYRDTDYGQLVALKERNEFEMQYFGRLFPDVDNVKLSQLFVFKLNQLQKQLRVIAWLIVAVFILVLVILLK